VAENFLKIKKVVRSIRPELICWIDEMVRSIPGRAGSLFRRIWLRHRLSSLGDDAFFETGVAVGGGKNISIGHRFSVMRNSSLYAYRGALQIGDRVAVNSNVIIDACENGFIEIGDDVLIGPNVVLRASNHVFESREKLINEQGHTGGKIVVQNDVWIASNVVTSNVTIGAHSVVAACSVVTHDVEAWTVVGGVPARLIKRR
jgi:galactoside O-acetyltransferase